MAILLSTKAHTMQDWKAALLAVDPSLEIRLFPDAGDPAEIEAAVVWTAHDMMELRRYPNLKLIVSMGAGVDHLLRAPGPPPGIPVARLKDVLLTSAMAEWVLLNVLRFHRQDPEYRALQQRKEAGGQDGRGWPDILPGAIDRGAWRIHAAQADAKLHLLGIQHRFQAFQFTHCRVVAFSLLVNSKAAAINCRV